MKRNILGNISKLGLSALVLPLLVSSCFKNDSTPLPAAEVTFDFTIRRVGYDGVDIKNPVKHISLFFRDDVKKIVYGPVEVTFSEAYTSEDNIMKFTGAARLPYGKYTVWMWGNVANRDVLSLDKYSVNTKDNIFSDDLFLGTARVITFERQTYTLFWELHRLTGKVNITNALGDDITPKTLFISDVAQSVNADMVFSGVTNMECNSASITELPPYLYMFPSQPVGTESEFHFTYETQGSDGPVLVPSIAYTAIVAGEESTVTFSPE